MLPIGLNMCTPGDQELISLAKSRYSLVSNTTSSVISLTLITLDHGWEMCVRKKASILCIHLYTNYLLLELLMTAHKRYYHFGCALTTSDISIAIFM